MPATKPRKKVGATANRIPATTPTQTRVRTRPAGLLTAPSQASDTNPGIGAATMFGVVDHLAVSSTRD